MESYLTPQHYDLVTPDGRIAAICKVDERKLLATVKIEDISPLFVGYEIDLEQITFNLKSTLAQLGIDGICREFHFERKHNAAEVKIELIGIGHLAIAMLKLLEVGAYIGKLFAADDRRRVRDPDYLMRMFGKSDRKGRPLLSLGGVEGSSPPILEKIEGRTIAFISLLDGVVIYEKPVYEFLPTLAKALCENIPHTRQLLRLHQRWEKGVPRRINPNEILLVKSAPLHIQTVYAHVVDALLPQGMHHTSANFLQPDTSADGDIYELYGVSNQIIDDIPLEFFTL